MYRMLGLIEEGYHLKPSGRSAPYVPILRVRCAVRCRDRQVHCRKVRTRSFTMGQLFVLAQLPWLIGDFLLIGDLLQGPVLFSVRGVILAIGYVG